MRNVGHPKVDQRRVPRSYHRDYSVVTKGTVIWVAF